MSRRALVFLAWVMCSCGPPSTLPDVDGGPPDSGTTDAGADAGPQRTCAPGPIAPSAYDCAANEPTITFGAPITANAQEWTFVPFPEAHCMDGSSTGIGVSLSPGSDRVVIYLEGGGACFDFFTCTTVANPHGFDAADFAFSAQYLDVGLFDRTDANNPLRDANFVYVPYCTGDVHAGTNAEGPSGRMHVGYRNIEAYLARLVPTFASASHVLLTGRSAGGLGTIINFDQVQRAFDCTPVQALDDAGAVLSDTYLKPCLASLVRETWGLDAIIPSDCPQCACSDGGGLWNIFPYLARRYPDHRFGLLTSLQDATFRSFYSYGYSADCATPSSMPGADYEAGLFELREAMGADANFGTFYLSGDQHTFTYMPLGDVSAEGVTLGEWIRRLLENEAFGHLGP